MTRTNADLRDKFFGCIAGCHIGSAMGAAVEGWPWRRIEEEYGTLDRLLPYEHYDNGWVREPGTTEDGVERQKLMIAAILAGQDRVTAEDVRRSWIENMDPDAPGNVSEPFERTLLALAKSGIPAVDIGKYCDYAGLVSFARSCHPVALVNAGDPATAVTDALNVGCLYQVANSRGLQWAAVTAIAIAAATKPGATVESVLSSIHDHADPDMVLKEVDRGLALTESCRDFRAMREAFDGVYSGAGIPYALSFANEIVTKAVCIFRMVGGDLKDAVIAGVNMGRDTDCVTAIAAGISGALGGAATLPPEWVEQTDRATELNPYTNSKRTLRATSDALFGAFQARLKRLTEYAAGMSRE
ncbi:MAG: ADP-ribosylglycohydrolase family protein [Planctomycetota bacterium]|jgi:ADP-ribosylglycohydrolase